MDEKVEYSHLEFHEELGEGAFGTVNRVTFKKPFKGYTEAAAKSVRSLRKEEVEVMSQLHHPNIVTWIAFYKNGPINVILLEYAKNGSLHDYLADASKPLPDDLKRKWARESALAIRYLHERQFLHRDVKPRNCLLLQDNVLKLCDFGLVRQTDHSFTLSSQKGTCQYMAPEIIKTDDSNRATYSKYTDIYAYGMLVQEICTRKPPFDGMEYAYVIYHVGHGVLQPVIQRDCPRDLADLMKQCWNVNPRQRPTADKIVKALSRWSLEKVIHPLHQGKPVEAHKVACCPNGDIVIGDRRKLYRIGSEGECKMQLTSPERDYDHALWSITVSSQDYVLAVDDTRYVKVYEMNGKYHHCFSTLMDGEDPNTKVNLQSIAIDREGHVLVGDSHRDIITIHTCPGGEVVNKVECSQKVYSSIVVNSKKQILQHFRPSGSMLSKVVAIDYFSALGSSSSIKVEEAFAFTPRMDLPVGKKVTPCGIAHDICDNIYIVMKISGDSCNTGHVHKYSPTGAFLGCIAKDLYYPCDLSITTDGSSLLVANLTSVLIYTMK